MYEVEQSGQPDPGCHMSGFKLPYSLGRPGSQGFCRERNLFYRHQNESSQCACLISFNARCTDTPAARTRAAINLSYLPETAEMKAHALSVHPGGGCDLMPMRVLPWVPSSAARHCCCRRAARCGKGGVRNARKTSSHVWLAIPGMQPASCWCCSSNSTFTPITLRQLLHQMAQKL